MSDGVRIGKAIYLPSGFVVVLGSSSSSVDASQSSLTPGISDSGVGEGSSTGRDGAEGVTSGSDGAATVGVDGIDEAVMDVESFGAGFFFLLPYTIRLEDEGSVDLSSKPSMRTPEFIKACRATSACAFSLFCLSVSSRPSFFASSRFAY